MSSVHDAARSGFSSGAETYARARPEYSDELLPWLMSTLQATAPHAVVDVGAGTGKFTQLLARTGATIIAVEPVDEMRMKLQAKLPAVRAVRGTAQEMPLNAGEAHAVVCAQAFHWFASEASLAEFHRVLEPGGRLGLVWNVRDESVDWVAESTEIITPYEGDAPRHYKGDWKRVFPSPLFTEPQVSNFLHTHVGPPVQVLVERLLSTSFIAALPDPEKAEVKRKLEHLAATHPALRGQETVAFPYRTEAWYCLRRD